MTRYAHRRFTPCPQTIPAGARDKRVRVRSLGTMVVQPWLER